MAFLSVLLLSALLVGCGGSKSGRSSVGGDPGTSLYSIGGTISGLDGTVVLQNSGGNNLSRSANGAFTFTTSLAAGSNYAVTVLTQPSGQTCSVANGSGTVGSANVSNVAVTCADDPTDPDPARSNADLDSLTLSVGALDQIFQPGQFSYTSTQAFPVANLTITPTAAASGATITVNGVAVTSGNASQSIAIAEGVETMIAIAVTSADSSNTRTYTVAVTRQAAGAFAQQAYIKASNAEGLDQFGWSVALSGDTLVVGTPFEDSRATGINGDEADNGMFSSGAVYVFVRNGATWTQQAYVKASNTGSGAHFGFSVAVSGDTLVVGAPGERSGSVADPSDESAINAGAVYVFERSGTTWSEQAYLKASNIGTGDLFGWSVALSGDTLAAGATGEGSGIVGDPSDNSAQQSGAAYVFVRNGTNWTQQAYIKASNPDANDEFGTSIALSGDTLAVGAPFEDSAATGIGGNAADNSASSSGAAYIFARSGTTWSQQAYIKASNTDAIDQFGASIALFGNMLAVGAPYESSAATGVGGNQASNSALRSGAVYVFVSDGTNWTQQAYIKASNTDPNDMFGGSVALSYSTLAVGARYEESRATGVGGDETDNSTNWNGAVYVYTLSGTTWAQRDYVKASNTGADDQFGGSVALAGGTLAVGAINEDSAAPGIGGDEADDSAPRSGAVYVYTGPVGS